MSTAVQSAASLPAAAARGCWAKVHNPAPRGGDAQRSAGVRVGGEHGRCRSAGRVSRRPLRIVPCVHTQRDAARRPGAAAPDSSSLGRGSSWAARTERQLLHATEDVRLELQIRSRQRVPNRCDAPPWLEADREFRAVLHAVPVSEELHFLYLLAPPVARLQSLPATPAATWGPVAAAS
jgi:hypothetical protein